MNRRMRRNADSYGVMSSDPELLSLRRCVRRVLLLIIGLVVLL